LNREKSTKSFYDKNDFFFSCYSLGESLLSRIIEYPFLGKSFQASKQTNKDIILIFSWIATSCQQIFVNKNYSKNKICKQKNYSYFS